MLFTADNAIQTTAFILVFSCLLPGLNTIPVCNTLRQELPDDFDIFNPGCHHPQHNNAIRKYYARLPGLITVSLENLSRIMDSLSTQSKEKWEFMTDVLSRGETFSPCASEMADLEQHLSGLNPGAIVYDREKIEQVHVKWTRALMCQTIYLHNAKRNAECSHEHLLALAISNDKIITTSRRLLCTFAPRRLPDDLREEVEGRPAYHVPHNAYRREVDNFIILNNFRILLERARSFLQQAVEGYMMALL